MSERITKGMIIRKFKLFTTEAKIPISAKWMPKKHQYSRRYLKLDYNKYYGGWRMDWVNKNTSESFFSGMSRRSSKEMLSYLDGLLDRVRFKKRR